MNIYIGNLPYQTTEEDLRLIFEPFGEINSVNIIKDRYSGQSKGFGFVEMPRQSEAEPAIEQLNGMNLKGRSIKVNRAKEKEREKSPRPARNMQRY